MINMDYKTLKDDYEKLIHIMNKHNNEKLINTQNETFLAPTTLIPLFIMWKRIINKSKHLTKHMITFYEY